MDDVPPAPAAAPERVGDTLRQAREARGLSLAELAARTRVPMRHLQAIEQGDYSGLPSHTYATGFAKAYARAVDADEVAVARRVRGELARVGPRQPEYQPYEAPDPKRVPSRGLTIVTLGLAVAAIVLIGLWYAGFLTAGTAPSDTLAAAPDAAPVAAPTRAPAAPPVAAAPVAATGTVTLATTGRVWMRVHDGDKVLYDGTMDPGGTFEVPADAKDPLVDIGRPDKLTVALNGRPAPTLPPSAKGVENLRVGAAAVAARLNGAGAPAATPTPAPSPTAERHEARSPSRRHAEAAPRRHAEGGDETARANRDAAAAPAPAATPQP